MTKNTQINYEFTELNANVIDYRHYERRARCLRSISILRWFQRWILNKNYSSDMRCDDVRVAAAGNG